jgi:hypothetical protein
LVVAARFVATLSVVQGPDPFDVEKCKTLRTPHSPTATANAIAAAEAALKVAQSTAIDALVADVTSLVTEKNRPVLTSCCELTPSELQIFEEFTRVFDKARSHFVFEIVRSSTPIF